MNEVNGRRLEIDALRALSAIRQHGGITRAAAALGLSQSAVSHKIKRLEVSLDCELLGRKPAGPMFTAAGEDLLDYAGRILEDYTMRRCSAFRRRRSLEGLHWG